MAELPTFFNFPLLFQILTVFSLFLSQNSKFTPILGKYFDLQKFGFRQPSLEPPNFNDIQCQIIKRIEEGCKESQKLNLKLAATFEYGIFSRPQPKFNEKLIRIDLSKLPTELRAIAAESLAWQLMNQHRLMGEIKGKLPRTFLFIDEAKEMPKKEGSACDFIICDGRKYGLSLILASQSERHLSQEVIGNSATKIVLPVDACECAKVAKKFRFAEKKVASLTPLTALCRFGKEAELLEILPYYQRLEDA